MLTSSATGESTFRAMLDAAPDAMVGVNSEGVIVMVNVQTEAVFGYVDEPGGAASWLASHPSATS